MGVVSTSPLSCGYKDFVRSGHSQRASLILNTPVFFLCLLFGMFSCSFFCSFFSCVQTLYLLGIFLKLKHNFFFLVLCFANVFHLVCVVDYYLLLALYGNARHSHLRSELVVEGGSLFLCGVT